MEAKKVVLTRTPTTHCAPDRLRQTETDRQDRQDRQTDEIE